MYKRAHETDTVISPLVGGDEVDGLLRSPKRTPKTVLKTKQDYRRMWKEAIEQQIMLNRMQKMNKDFDGKTWSYITVVVSALCGHSFSIL